MKLCINLNKKQPVNLIMIIKVLASFRDGNSSENFIPRGIEESRNDNFTFLGVEEYEIYSLGSSENFEQ